MKIRFSLLILLLLIGLSAFGCSTDTAKKENINKSDDKIKGKIIKYSKDNKNFLNEKKVDISLNQNDSKTTLFITKEEAINFGGTNKPIRLKLKVANEEATFVSMWNDGIYISAADFYSGDKYTDIYITEAGTDIESTTHIYRMDNSKIYKYAEFKHFGSDFSYDGEGNIYYWYNNDSSKEINTLFNYKIKQASIITDESLKTTLNKK